MNQEKKFIVACGGGIVLDKDNIKIMKATGIVYCLDVPAHEVLKRTAGTTHRPLLNVSSPKEKIELLLKMRAPFYAQADKTINTANLSVKEVADKIIKLIAKKR